MALTPASILADYSSGIGTQGATLKVDANNERVGIGTTNPQGTLQVGTAITMGSGIVTATSFDASTASFSGNVSVGGVLTYEDVTSVDSVGIVTARDDIHVGGGLSVTGISTFNGITTSTTTLFANNFSVSGVSTLGGNVVVGGATTELVVTGDARVTGILTVGTASLTLDGATGNVTGASLHDTQISAINTSIVGTGTTVDVFVYDTRKDSDGGAWRKRTQHTSWYNETLNTAIRGSRREFPAVAVIVAEAATVTIYDGDDPDLPLWISFPTTNAKAVTALNGELCLVCHDTSPAYHGLLRINFIADRAYNHRNTTNATVQGYFIYTLSSTDLAKLDDGASSWTGYTSEVPNLINANINDVAVTVLPNAPIDDTTGLPVPTIAVATNGGVSAIKDDGNVIDLSDNLGVSRQFRTVMINGEDVTGFNWNNGTIQRFFNALALSADSSLDMKYNYTIGGGGGSTENISATLRNTSSSDILLEKGSTVKDFYAATTDGLSMYNDGEDRTFTENTFSITDSSVAYATTSYNTGWMHGDIKGAFLSGISTTNASELVTNGTFNSDASGWNSGQPSHVTVSQSGGVLQVVISSGNDGSRYAYQQINNVPAGTYRVTATAVSNPSNRAILRVGTSDQAGAGGGNATNIFNSGYLSGSNATSTHLFTTTETSNIVISLFNDLVSGTGTWDNVKLHLAEEDRSVGNNPLQVFGTITKSAVATGADLVGYSGFSNTNYLQQPYNSDLEFGTNDFSVTFWAYRTTGNTKIMFDRSRQNGTQNSRFSIYYNTSGSVDVYEGGGSTMSASGALPLNVWTQITFVKSSSQGYLYENGNLVAGPTAFTTNHNDASSNPKLVIGNGYDYTYGWEGSLALVRVSTSAPSATQIKKIYEDEKVLFQENAKATLYGSSDAVTALAYDDDEETLYVGTSSGRSDFRGLRRINNTTTAVTTAISASNGLVAEE